MAILRAQKPDGTYGDLRMDAKGRLLVHNGLDGPRSLLDYPRIGAPDAYLAARNDEYLFYRGGGESGKVINLWINSPAALDPTAELRIYVDAGDIADPTEPPVEHLAARIPLQTLLGLRWDASLSNPRDTAIMTCVQHPMIAGQPVFELTLPIPYSNGCLIQIWQNDEVRPVAADDFTRTEFETGPLPKWQYSGWRLRSGAFDGAVTWDNTEPYAAESQAVFLNSSSGPGMLVALHAAMKSLAAEPSWDYCLNQWGLSMDQAEFNWGTYRTEDMFSGCGDLFQLGLIGPYFGYTWGLIHYGYVTAEWEAYKLFTKAPIIWSNGCVGFWSNHLDSTSGDIEAHILALYYAP